jgi:hypothetical protein
MNPLESISSFYLSTSQLNNNDLRELIHSVYSLQEIFIHKFDIDPENIILKDIILPQISIFNPYIFVFKYRLHLEISIFLQSCIDLIIGFNQSYVNAILYKNEFLINCSFDSTSEQLNLEYNSFENIVLSFGQNPQQIFISPHLHQIL